MIPDLRLPPLREDLQVLQGGPSYSGAPTWMVLDPIRNRYFRISYEMFQLLSVWKACANLAELGKALESRFARPLDVDEVGLTIKMLDSHFLLAQPVSGSWQSLAAAARKRHSLLMQLVHHYLFFKIPLVRPQAFIRASWPFVSLFFSRTFLAVTLLVGILALYLISRQWDEFAGAFPYLFTLEGAALSLLSIAFVKSLHELGHAYAAHRFGCRVPTIGVAFMVMVPLLYTDVTDAWRLRLRRQRIFIDAAGVMVELCVAAYAAFLWVFLPDGALRSAVFAIATTGWLLSLLVNTNPMMRFDGYYILADFLGIENLQSRAFRHMRWRLARLLFATSQPPPENFPRHLDIAVTLYAIATTIYRVALYVGIALLVYHFTIKIVGILLFCVEVAFFMIRPLFSLFQEWWAMRSDILRSGRTYVSLGLLAMAILGCTLPLSTGVSAPALMMPQNFTRLFPDEPGQLEKIHVRENQEVAGGETLFSLSLPGVEQELKLVQLEIDLGRQRLTRISANPDDLSQKAVLEANLRRLEQKRAGLETRFARRLVVAPFAGVVKGLNPEMAAGQWLARNVPLAYISSATGYRTRGYVAAEDRYRIDAGANGWFVPDDISQARVPVTVSWVGISDVRQIDLPQLSSQHGGKIAVHPSTDGREVPVSALYFVEAAVNGDVLLAQTRPGLLLIDGTAESLFSRVWRRVLTVLVREAGL